MSTVRVNREIYRRPPIVEAIIDIQCVNRPDLTVRDLSGLADTFLPEYEAFSESVEVAEKRDANGAFQKTERIVGHALRSPDERYVLQSHLDGFAFSRLAPYERWELFRDRAATAWKRYAQCTEPEVLRRIGVRYINRVELGVEAVEDLSMYTRLHPVTPWSLTAPPDGFFLQVRYARRNCAMIVNESVVQSAPGQNVALVLDLDAASETEVSRDDAYLWNVIEELHVEVETAFEASITERIRESIR